MRKVLLLVAVVLTFPFLTAIPGKAGLLGCMVGGAGGGYGGSFIGNGSGQLAATAAGTLLGCVFGSNIQDRDNYRQAPGVYVHDSYQLQTYKERYGGYTMTEYGYVPINRATGYVTTRPGYTYSRSIYYDQRPEVFGIYPVHRRVVEHVIATPRVIVQQTPAPVTNYSGCVIYNGKPYLREYQTTIRVGGRNVPAYGTACYQPDGQWKLISELIPAH